MLPGKAKESCPEEVAFQWGVKSLDYPVLSVPTGSPLPRGFQALPVGAQGLLWSLDGPPNIQNRMPELNDGVRAVREDGGGGLELRTKVWSPDVWSQ